MRNARQKRINTFGIGSEELLEYGRPVGRALATMISHFIQSDFEGAESYLVSASEYVQKLMLVELVLWKSREGYGPADEWLKPYKRIPGFQYAKIRLFDNLVATDFALAKNEFPKLDDDIAKGAVGQFVGRWAALETLNRP